MKQKTKIKLKMPLNYDSLAYLTDALVLVQKTRVALQVRLTHLKKQNRKDLEAEDLMKKAVELQKYITKRIAFQITSHPAYHWFSRVKGVGSENIAKVITEIDIRKAKHISSLWKWFGFTPDSKRQKGKQLDFNIHAKSMMWRLSGLSLMKAKGKFYYYYLSEKKKFASKCQAKGLTIKPQASIRKKDKNVISEGHVHNYALRKVSKLFLGCLWLVWRKAEKLPMSNPYAIDRLGHTGMIKPEEMIDEKKTEVVKSQKKTRTGKRAKTKK